MKVKTTTFYSEVLHCYSDRHWKLVIERGVVVWGEISESSQITISNDGPIVCSREVWKTYATRLEPTKGRLCHGTEVVQQSHKEEGKLLLFCAECEIFYYQIVLYIYKCIMALSNFFIRLIVEVCKQWQNVKLHASLNTNCTERFSCYAFHWRVTEPWKPASRLSGCINLKIWMRIKLIMLISVD